MDMLRKVLQLIGYAKYSFQILEEFLKYIFLSFLTFANSIVLDYNRYFRKSSVSHGGEVHRDHLLHLIGQWSTQGV